MPHATNTNRCEEKVRAFARALSARLAGGAGDSSFLMVLTDAGSVRTLRFEPPNDGWHGLVEDARRAGVAFIFYDPFEPREWLYLEWCKVERGTMERLIGTTFEAADFIEQQHRARASGGPPPGSYPATWSVMF